MNDNLFEMLMDFFEKSLSQISESKAASTDKQMVSAASDDAGPDNQSLTVRAAHPTSMRVFTPEETFKFTKASYQFITRMLLWGIIASENMEMIIDQLLFSESRFITLEETKWTIRNVLAENLDASQLAFLDLVLYQKEDNLPLH